MCDAPPVSPPLPGLIKYPRLNHFFANTDTNTDTNTDDGMTKTSMFQYDGRPVVVAPPHLATATLARPLSVHEEQTSLIRPVRQTDEVGLRRPARNRPMPGIVYVACFFLLAPSLTTQAC